MIQRLQTVYLIAIIMISAIVCGGQLIDSRQVAFDTATQSNVANDYILNALYFKTYQNGNLVSSEVQYVLILLLSLVMGWTLNIILGFKNRKRQIMHTRINFIFIGAFIAAVFIKAFMLIPGFNFSAMSVKATIGLALLFFMLYLNLRAMLLIRKDENLVRSADRIR